MLFNCIYGAEKPGTLIVVNSDGTRQTITDPKEKDAILEQHRKA